MNNGPVTPLAAGACFLLAAVASIRNRQLGAWLGAAGAAILGGGLVARGLQAGYWPLTSQYEFALAFALGTSLATLAVGTPRRGRVPAARFLALLLAAGLAAYARLGLPASKQASQPLSPILDSAWLPLHVGSAALAYGALAVAGTAGLAWLLREEDRAPAGWLLDRAIAAGYPLLTLSLIFGMIWAEVAWGRYWSWDLKEIWTLITWLVYSLYWHVRQRRGWQGRRLAWLVLAGLGAVLFTFLGVGWLARAVGLESLHLF